VFTAMLSAFLSEYSHGDQITKECMVKGETEDFVNKETIFG